MSPGTVGTELGKDQGSERRKAAQRAPPRRAANPSAGEGAPAPRLLRQSAGRGLQPPAPHGPLSPSCPALPRPASRGRYLPKQPEDVHGVLPLVLPDGGLDLPQPPHPPHVGRGRGFPQHPGQLLRVQQQGGEVEVSSAALQPAGAGLLAALLLQAALPAQPGAHGRAAAALRTGRARGCGPGEVPGKAGGSGCPARPAPPRLPVLPTLPQEQRPGAPVLRGSVLGSRLPGQPRCLCSRGASSSRVCSAGRCSVGKTKRDADAAETAPSIQAFLGAVLFLDELFEHRKRLCLD